MSQSNCKFCGKEEGIKINKVQCGYCKLLVRGKMCNYCFASLKEMTWCVWEGSQGQYLKKYLKDITSGEEEASLISDAV